jgi:hypothetical protein
MGSWTTSSFSASGAWSIGWAYSCTRATAGPPFQVLVVHSGSTTAPVTAVTGTADAGSGVTAGGGPGTFELQVEADPYCTSAVKVTAPAT